MYDPAIDCREIGPGIAENSKKDRPQAVFFTL